jgi:TfoX/Sxy family transcriptional regulator of competence genes
LAYDEDLVHRVRELLAGESAVTEKKMFGGYVFLVERHLCVAASRDGGLLARIDPADTDEALRRCYVELMEMRGRTMDGWLKIAPEGLKTKRQLQSWVARSTSFVATLPPK